MRGRNASGKYATEPSDTLLGENWNVPVLTVADLGDVTVSTSGVALVSMVIGKRLVQDCFRVEACLGLLLPAPVLVTDRNGKMQVSQSYLH